MFKMPQWWSRSKTATDAADSLAAFGSEGNPADPGVLAHARGLRVSAPLAIAILISAGAAGGYFLKWRPLDVEAASASVTIESDPSGAEVLANGVLQGTTPVTLAIAPGEHAFELVYQGRRKPLRTLARAGAAVVHHVQLGLALPPTPSTKASLSVVTEPPRLRVFLDGKALGISPLFVRDLEPGARTVQVRGSTGTVERKVDLYAGENAAVIVSAGVPPPAAAGPAAGWLTVRSPVVWQIVEGKDVLGTTESAKILLPAGRHELQLTNEPLGLRERRTVDIKPGLTVVVGVDVPSAPLNINALPWAEVWVDGKRVGETPIANHWVTAGTHEVLFRHPEFGDRRQSITVSLKTPARASVDMRKPQ